MVKDPVCGMNVDDKDATAVSEYNGRMYCFCSTSCKENFDRFPDNFVKNGNGNNGPSNRHSAV